MHGMVFVALEQHLRDIKQEAVRAECFAPGAYLAIGNYPDADVLAIAERFANRKGLLAPESVTEVLRSFGEAVPSLISRLAPNLMSRASSLAELLAQVDKATRGDGRTILPPFLVAPRDDGLLALRYQGHPKLCRFAEGMLIGFAAHSGETVAFRHPSCCLRGDGECLFVARMLRSETTTRMRVAAERGR